MAAETSERELAARIAALPGAKLIHDWLVLRERELNRSWRSCATDNIQHLQGRAAELADLKKVVANGQ